MPRHALLIVNRKSRTGEADIDSVVARLKSHGIEVIDHKLNQPHQISAVIYHHCRHIDCVIVGGGDGSLSAAAPALVHTGLPLGILPMGTANDLARTLEIPTDMEQACEVIAAGLVHQIDLGSANGHYFFNVANIGLGVHVTHHLSSGLKQRWGIFSYGYSLLKAIQSFRPFSANIVCNGRRKRIRSIQIAIGNGRHYGGGMTIAEQASIDDGQFYFYSVKPLRLWELIKSAPAFRTGKFTQSDPVIIERGHTIEIITRKPMAVTADGEPATHTPVKFEMHARAVNVFVPPSYFCGDRQINHDIQKQATIGAE